MGAETDSSITVVRLVIVAIFIMLAIAVPAKLLSQSEGDDQLMSRSVSLLADTVQELLDDPAPFATKEILLTLPKDDKYVVVGYDSDTNGPISCYDDGRSGRYIDQVHIRDNTSKDSYDIAKYGI